MLKSWKSCLFNTCLMRIYACFHIILNFRCQTLGLAASIQLLFKHNPKKWSIWSTFVQLVLVQLFFGQLVELSGLWVVELTDYPVQRLQYKVCCPDMYGN
jgi:hypothetical protein